MALRGYGLTVDDAMKLPIEFGEGQIWLLEKYKIPPKYSLEELLEGKTAGETIEKYSMEMTGVSAKRRNEYKLVHMPDQYREDNSIRIWAENGITPNHLWEIIVKSGKESVTTAFKLVEQGKLNRKIFDEWIPEFSIDDAICAWVNNYTIKEARDIRDIYKTSLTEFHRDYQKDGFRREFRKDRDYRNQPNLPTSRPIQK
jgi:hypothetical protein